MLGKTHMHVPGWNALCLATACSCERPAETPTKETGLGHLVPSPTTMSSLFLWSRKHRRGPRQDQTQGNSLFMARKWLCSCSSGSWGGSTGGFPAWPGARRVPGGGGLWVITPPQVVGSTKGTGDAFTLPRAAAREAQRMARETSPPPSSQAHAVTGSLQEPGSRSDLGKNRTKPLKI